MSRCYPFPPPGYAKKLCSSHESLIFQIKPSNQKERAISDYGAEKLIPEMPKSSEKRKDNEHRKEKKDKKDRKSEKKDKGQRRKEKDEKKREKKAKASAIVDNGKHVDDGKLPKAGNVAFQNNGKLQGSSAELLERSSVTEEHGQPIEPQNTSCSSDSTGNSGKRKRVVAPPSGIQSNGNVIRIRFSSSQNKDEPSTSGSKEKEIGPISHAVSQNHVRPDVTMVKPESSVQFKDVISKGLTLPHTTSTSTATLQQVPVRDNISQLKEKTTESIFKKEKLSSRDKKMQKQESLFNKLFLDWVPPPLETLLVDENEDGEDDEEWLFGKKGEDRSVKRSRVSEEYQTLGDNPYCSASAVMQPRAQLLPDVGIYALPFTVPF